MHILHPSIQLCLTDRTHYYSDNRDLSVMLNWEPPQCQDPDLKKRTFDQDIAYLRLKDALVSAIALCIEMSDNRPVEEKTSQRKELEDCIEAYSTAIERCKDYYKEKEKICISAPFPSRIIGKS